MDLSVPFDARQRPALLPARLVVRFALATLLAVLLLSGQPGAELRIRQVAGRHAFLLLDWELERLSERGGRIGASLIGRQPAVDDAARAAVGAYFRAPASAREPLRSEAEDAIERGLSTLLRDEGLVVTPPLAPNAIVFPPVSFSFVSPPQVLIVSPRDRIAVEQSELLRPDVSVGQAADLEAAVDRQGVSSLVVPIGGLATYPAMVLEGSRPLDALVGVVHEWVHGYLFFRPLGQAYWSSQAARTINETATELAARELGTRLVGELGLSESPSRRPRESSLGGASGPDREFRTIMRAARVTVDGLLAEGRIAEAEAHMAERRDELAAAGYDIRKLNQAYFAFYGSYGEGASGSSRIPDRLRRLREASPSLGEFLRRVAELTDADDLARAVGDT